MSLNAIAVEISAFASLSINFNSYMKVKSNTPKNTRPSNKALGRGP